MVAETETKKQYWSNTTYYAPVFDRKELHDKDFTAPENAQFQQSFERAAKIAYKLFEGSEPTGLNRQQLNEWAIKLMRENDSQTLGVTGRGSVFAKRKLDGADNNQLLAYRYLKDVYDLYDDVNGLYILSSLKDATTLPFLILSGGASTLAKAGGTKLTSMAAARTVGTALSSTDKLVDAGAKLTGVLAKRNALSGAFAGATFEGAFSGLADDHYRQGISIRLGEQEYRDGGRTLQSVMFGTVLGGAMGFAGGKLLGGKHTSTLVDPKAAQIEAAEKLVKVMPGRSNFTPYGQSELAKAITALGSTPTAPQILAAENAVKIIANATTLTPEGERLAKLMASARGRYGITINDISAKTAEVTGRGGPFATADIFDNSRRATLELVSDSRLALARKTSGMQYHNNVIDRGIRSTGQSVEGILNGAVATPGRFIPEYENTKVFALGDWMRGNGFGKNRPTRYLADITRHMPGHWMFGGRYFIRPGLDAIDNSIVSDIGRLVGTMQLTDPTNFGSQKLGNTIFDECAGKLKKISEDLGTGTINSVQAKTLLEIELKALNSNFTGSVNTYNAVRLKLGRELDSFKSLNQLERNRSLSLPQVEAFENYLKALNTAVTPKIDAARVVKDAIALDIQTAINNITGGSAPGSVSGDISTALTRVYTDVGNLKATARPPIPATSPIPSFMQDAEMRLKGIAPSEMNGRRAGGGKTFSEDRRALERGLVEGYYNPHSRTLPVEMPTTNNIPNAERSYLEIENYWKTVENYDAMRDAPALARKLYDIYKVGADQEAMYGLRHLGMGQGKGRGKGFDTKNLIEIVPAKVLQELKAMAPTGGPHFDFYLKKLEKLQLDIAQWHSTDKFGQRAIYQMYQDWTYKARYALRFPQTDRLSMMFKIDTWRTPTENLWTRNSAWWFGKNVVPDPSDKTGAHVTSEWQWSWMKKPAAGADGPTSWYGRAPSWIKAPVRIGSGGLLSKPGLIGYPLLIAAGVGINNLRGEENSWENLDANLGHKVLTTAIIPAKTLAGAGVGWWNNEGIILNPGIIPGGAKGFANGGRDALDTWVGGMKIPFTGYTIRHFGTDAEEQNTADRNRRAATPGAPGISAAGTGQPGTPGAAGVTISDADKQQLLALGTDVTKLVNAAGREGWDDAKKAELQRLQGVHATMQANPDQRGFGPHAKTILTDAGNRINNLLVPYARDNRPTPSVTPFEDVEAARKTALFNQMAPWYNGVLNLNNNVARDGWTERRKKDLETLKAAEEKFHSNIPFLDKNQQNMHKFAFSWQAMLLTSSASNEPVASINAPAATPVEVDANGRPLGGTPVANVLQPPPGGPQPAPTPDPNSNANTGGTGNTGGTNNQQQQGQGQQRNTGTNNNGNTGGTGNNNAGNTPRPPSAPGKDALEHVSDASDAFFRSVAIDDPNNVTDTVNSGLRAAGVGAKNAGGWLSRTWTRLMNKPDGSGRALVRETGAGLISLIGMAAVVSPLLDKLGIGKIPIIGSLAKLAALVCVFMIARKGIHSFMDKSPVSPGADNTGAGAGAGSTTGPVQGGGIHINRFGLNGQQATGQPHTGGLPQPFTIGDPDDHAIFKELAPGVNEGKPVLQMKADNGETFVSLGTASPEVLQSLEASGRLSRDRYRHVPTYLLNAQRAAFDSLKVETITHDKVGGDAFVLTIDNKAHIFLMKQGMTMDQMGLERN